MAKYAVSVMHTTTRCVQGEEEQFAFYLFKLYAYHKVPLSTQRRQFIGSMITLPA